MPDLEPINVATPQWACPICNKNHGNDLAAAELCVSYGSADDIDLSDGAPIMFDLSEKNPDDALGLMEIADTPRPNTSTRTHVRDMMFNGERLHAHHIPENVTSDGINFIKGQNSHTIQSVSPKRQKQYLIPELFGFTSHFSPYTDFLWDDFLSTLPASSDSLWFAPLTDKQRILIETVAPVSAERLADHTAETLYWSWVTHTGGNASRNRIFNKNNSAGVRPAPDRNVLHYLAISHGFSVDDNVGMFRWVNVNWESILRYLAEQFVGWWAGETSCPRFALSHDAVKVPNYGGVLPKTPGLRRIEILAPFLDREIANKDKGDDIDYRHATQAVIASITAPTVSCPVPDASDAETFYRTGL